MIEVQSRHALRIYARCTGRPSEGPRNGYHTAIRRALSPWRPCGSVPADDHGCPRGVAPLRHPLAIRATPVAHPGTGGAACPSLLFSPPGPGFSTLEARGKLML